MKIKAQLLIHADKSDPLNQTITLGAKRDDTNRGWRASMDREGDIEWPPNQIQALIAKLVEAVLADPEGADLEALKRAV